MNTTTAAGVAAAVTLAAVGGVSALFLTMGTGAASAEPPPAPTVITEYVDADGNPVDAPVTTAPVDATAPRVVDSPTPDPVYATEYVISSAAPSAADGAYEEHGEEEDHEDEEYEEHDEDGEEEHEDEEHEEHDEEEHDEHDEEEEDHDDD